MSWLKAICLIPHKITLENTKLINYKGAIYYNVTVGACAQITWLLFIPFSDSPRASFLSSSLLAFEISLSKKMALLFIDTLPRYHPQTRNRTAGCIHVRAINELKKTVCTSEYWNILLLSPFASLNEMSATLQDPC